MAHHFPLKKPYETEEHTADIRIKVKGKDLPELFKNSSLAIFDITTKERSERSPNQTFEIRQKARNLEELLINWLNELLSLSAVKEVVFTDFRIGISGNYALDGKLIGRSSKDFEFITEIKAATYSGLKIEKTDKGWQTEIIFDV